MAQRRSDLEQFFHPDGVAVLGRVPSWMDPDEIMAGYRARWGERVYLVNPKGGQLGDVTVYPSVADIPGDVGLAVVNVGPNYVADALEDCGKKGVGYALVFTAGFSEVGPEGAALEREIADVARRNGIRLFGPNTNTNAFEKMPEVPGLRGGKIGLLTQSGHQGRPIVQGSLFGIGFSRWIPTGNEADLEMADFLEYFAYDDETSVIAAYVEGFKDPANMRHALQAANDNGKPVVMLKIGSTEAGSRMASSHTGHLTGSDAVVDGLFAQHGVTRVRDLDELLETSALFAKLPAGVGRGVCCYSISGGSGTLMAEVAEANGLTLPALSAATQQRLHEFLPDYLTVANPVDNGGQFLLTAPAEKRLALLEIIANDPNVDVIVIGITGALDQMTDNFGADIKEFAPRSPVPLVVTWNSFKIDEQGFTDVVASGVPMFRSFRNCFTALRDYYAYQDRSQTFRERPVSVAGTIAIEGSGTLGPAETRRVLEDAGVPVVAEVVAAKVDDAAHAAQAMRYPVVLKIASPDFPHKSDAGLVRLGVATEDELRAGFDELIDKAHGANPSAHIDGVMVQQQIDTGTEMIVGAIHDPVLGPAVTVGTGGVFAEVLRDTAVRPLPIDEADAWEMVRGLRSWPLLDGARGRAKADVAGLVGVIMSVARLAASSNGRLAELDLNPVVVTPDGAVAVDALLVAAPGD
jgi:acyl-CoA synthetase (NDP forming)